MITVGLNNSYYPVQRNIASLPHEDVRFKKKYDLFKLPDNIYFRLTNRSSPVLLNTFCDFNLHWDVDLYHFFNAVSLSSRPWITTFETIIPRIGVMNECITRAYVRSIAGDSCKGIIAISDCARRLQLMYLEKNFPNYVDKIRKKMVHIFPSQEVLEPGYSDTKRSGTLNFIIVGHQFFGKGGAEILRVFDSLLPNYPALTLTIISSLRTDEYASFTGVEDRRQALALIKKWPDQIRHYHLLSQSEVLGQIRKADVALLPTFADTFGYFVLEAQACGVPVITTDIRALPEINNNDVGWIIPVPKDSKDNGALKTAEQRTAFSNTLMDGLEATIQGLLAGAEDPKEKGRRAHERIKQHHNPKLIASLVRQLYDNALS